MSEPLPVEHQHHLAHVVVHPVVADGVHSPFRRVDILGTQVGRAYGLTDVVEFMRRAAGGRPRCLGVGEPVSRPLSRAC